jgi:hypothetical protein
MTNVNLTTELPVPAAMVWNLIGGFNALPDWHPAIEKSEIEEDGGSTVRHLSLVGGGTIVERLDHVDESERLYSYSILSGPLLHGRMVQRVRSVWRARKRRRGGDPGRLRGRLREPEENARRLRAGRMSPTFAGRSEPNGQDSKPHRRRGPCAKTPRHCMSHCMTI